MSIRVIGISGSPTPNSNTDRLVRLILEETGQESAFVKLAAQTVKPCRGCLGCVNDNICKAKDDFQPIAEQVKEADAIVIGGYPPYGTIDGFTKAFLERMFSMRHRKGLNRGKLGATVITGNGRGATGIDAASEQVRLAMFHEGVEVLGQIKATGNVNCTLCGSIDNCPMSALPRLFDNDMSLVPQEYCRVEDQTETWQAAQELGREIGRRLQA